LIYLDHNATTPLHPEVLEAMLPFLRQGYGNPSSPHRFGREARAAVDWAREQVAALAGAHPSQVIFTSGGTESNNAAIKGVAGRSRPGRLAIGAIEHAAVRAPARALARAGWEVTTLPVDGAGRVSSETLHSALDDDTRLASVMWANNETGVLQDIPALAAAAAERGVVFHTDAVQAAGKIPLDFAASGVGMMSLSAHKLNGPKGVGALIVNKAVDREPLLHGGGQERGQRGGTENVAGIVGFGRAAELALVELPARQARLAALRDRFEQRLATRTPRACCFAAGAERLPNTSFCALPGVDGETLLLELDRQGFAVASGAACGSGEAGPSHVLLAMGVTPEEARGAIRISFGPENSEADADAVADALGEQMARLTRFAAVAW